MDKELPPIIQIGKAIGFSIPVIRPFIAKIADAGDALNVSALLVFYYRVTEIKGRWVLLEEIEKPPDDKTDRYSRGWWNTNLFVSVKEAPLSITDPKLFKELMAKLDSKPKS